MIFLRYLMFFRIPLRSKRKNVTSRLNVKCYKFWLSKLFQHSNKSNSSQKYFLSATPVFFRYFVCLADKSIAKISFHYWRFSKIISERVRFSFHSKQILINVCWIMVGVIKYVFNSLEAIELTALLGIQFWRKQSEFKQNITS